MTAFRPNITRTLTFVGRNWITIRAKRTYGLVSFSEPVKSAMSQPSYRVLRVILGFLSLVFAIAGVFLILSTKPLILRIFMHPPVAEITTLLLAAVKEMGGIVLMVSVMLFLAWRDPERNVAIIDGMAVGLCILGLTPLLSLYTLDLRKLYPASLIWLRSLVRLALAGLLYYLRPRPTLWKPPGHF